MAKRILSDEHSAHQFFLLILIKNCSNSDCYRVINRCLSVVIRLFRRIARFCTGSLRQITEILYQKREQESLIRAH